VSESQAEPKPSTQAAPIPCGVCGRPYETSRRLEQVARRWPACRPYVSICPDCRRKAEAERIARATRRAKMATLADDNTP